MKEHLEGQTTTVDTSAVASAAVTDRPCTKGSHYVSYETGRRPANSSGLISKYDSINSGLSLDFEQDPRLAKYTATYNQIVVGEIGQDCV